MSKVTKIGVKVSHTVKRSRYNFISIKIRRTIQRVSNAFQVSNNTPFIRASTIEGGGGGSSKHVGYSLD